MKISRHAKYSLLLIILLAAASACRLARDKIREPLSYVDPMIATGGPGFTVGSAYPGVTTPFGMVKVSPDTYSAQYNIPAYHCSGYYYPDNSILGFSHYRMYGTGAEDYGNILFMPTLGFDDNKITGLKYRSLFSHDREVATPGYYSVILDDTGIKAELTASDRCAFHKYTFPSGATNPHVLVDLGHAITRDAVKESYLEIDPNGRKISGYALNKGSLSGRTGGVKIFFTARFDRDFAEYGVWEDGAVSRSGKKAQGVKNGAFLGFAPMADTPLNVEVCLSFVDASGAEHNWTAEAAGRDFDQAYQDAVKKWRAALAKIEVQGGSDREKTIFFTSLFHARFMPTLYSDSDGRYQGFDKAIHYASGFKYYSDFSLWDTYRTLHPLLILIDKQSQLDMTKSMVKMAEQGGYIPKWATGAGYTNCMTGTAGDFVIAETYIKGLRDFDARKAYEAIRAAATGPTTPGSGYAGRPNVKAYMDLGYVPADLTGKSASHTLESAYSDYAVALLAQALGHEQDYRYFLDRSRYYRNIWDPTTGFFRPRNSDGSWVPDFDPLYHSSHYVEGNAYQFLWFVPHDTAGLAELMGGRAAFVSRLAEFFELSHHEQENLDDFTRIMPRTYYWHGNEPDIHAPYLFALAGRPDLTQKWVRWVMETRYGTGADGLAGNDDGGTLSSWYVFSALGFYPLAGTDIYVVGSPIFNSAKIDMGNVLLEITADNAGPGNIYVQSLTLNGTPLALPWFKHGDIAGGGKLHFVMGSQPGPWGRN